MSIAQGPLQNLLEQDTLDRWADQSPVPDLGAIYDQLREGLTAAQESCHDARFRHDHQAAAEAVTEITALTGLLDVLAEEMTWRRGQYMTGLRRWPLSGRMI